MVWNLFSLFTLIIGVFSILGFFARIWWPFDILDHFRVQYLVILVVIGMIQLLGENFTQSTVTLSFVIINIYVVVPVYFSRSSTSTGAVKLYRLLLVNVLRKNRQVFQVGQLIQSTSPDIILLLEPDDQWLDELRGFLDEYKFEYSQPRGDNYGIALFSLIPPDKVNTRVFGDLEVPSIEAEFKLSNKNIRIIGTHLTPPKGSDNTAFRTKQLEDLVKYVGGAQIPLIICGDFNLTPWSAHFRNFLRRTGLVDSTKGFGWQPTWPTFFFPMMIPIDHCLSSRGIKIINRQVGSKNGSDHLPLLIDFTVL